MKDDFDDNSGYERIPWDETKLLKTKKEYRKVSTRENLLRWHPQLLKMEEPLKTECVEWYRNRWDTLEIDDEQLKDEVDFEIARIPKFDSYSENWKLFRDRTNNRTMKVYSKKIWLDVPTLKNIRNVHNTIFFPYLDKNRINDVTPNILFVSKNYIGVEWLGQNDGWKRCEESDFVVSVLDTGIVTSEAIDFARRMQKFHLSSCEYFKNHMQQDDYEHFRNGRKDAAADRHEYGEDMSHLKNDQHRLYIGSHNYWPKDFVQRIDPETKQKVIRFIDFENLIINDATEFGYWYHKYKVSTDSYYKKHFTQHVQTIKKYQEENKPLKEDEFLATYVYRDTLITKSVKC